MRFEFEDPTPSAKSLQEGGSVFSRQDEEFMEFIGWAERSDAQRNRLRPGVGHRFAQPNLCAGSFFCGRKGDVGATVLGRPSGACIATGSAGDHRSPLHRGFTGNGRPQAVRSRGFVGATCGRPKSPVCSHQAENLPPALRATSLEEGGQAPRLVVPPRGAGIRGRGEFGSGRRGGRNFWVGCRSCAGLQAMRYWGFRQRGEEARRSIIFQTAPICLPVRRW